MSDNIPAPVDSPRQGLLEVVRERLRLKHCRIRTGKSYVSWIRRYIHFHGKRHPRRMGKAHIAAFLTALAVKRDVASATQCEATGVV